MLKAKAPTRISVVAIVSILLMEFPFFPILLSAPNIRRFHVCALPRMPKLRLFAQPSSLSISQILIVPSCLTYAFGADFCLNGLLGVLLRLNTPHVNILAPPAAIRLGLEAIHLCSSIVLFIPLRRWSLRPDSIGLRLGLALLPRLRPLVSSHFITSIFEDHAKEIVCFLFNMVAEVRHVYLSLMAEVRKVYVSLMFYTMKRLLD